MSKNDWIWVAIRIFGIYLVVLAIIAVPKLVTDAVHLGMIGNLVECQAGQGASADVVDKMNAQLMNATGASLSKHITQVLLFSICGIYFLRSGKLIFKLIAREQNS